MAYTRRTKARSSRRPGRKASTRTRSYSSGRSGRSSSRRTARRVSARSASRRSGGSQTVRLVIEQPAAVPAAGNPEATIASALAQIAANKAAGNKPTKAKF